MKVLVTGGAGYVGSTLVPELLQRGHSVRVLDLLTFGGESLLGVWPHQRFELSRGDLCDDTAVRDAVRGMDAVVHLAAIVGDPACARQPELAQRVNREASLNLIDASREAGIRRFVFASTCSNYGRMPDPDGYVDESAPLNPLSLYAETKVEVERALLGESTGTSICPVVLRFATVYGVSPRMRFDLTVNQFTAELAKGKRLCVFGAEFWRPYVHVRDAARAVALALHAPEDKVRCRHFNVGSTPENYRKRDLITVIQRHAPDGVVEFVDGPQKDDPRDYRVSFDRIERELRFRTSGTVEDGVREVARLVSTGAITNTEDPRYRN